MECLVLRSTRRKKRSNVFYGSAVLGLQTPHIELEIIILFFFYGSTALYGPGPPRFVEASRSHTLDTPQSVGLLWTSDQPVAETST
jgi:hypothetical protein